MFNTPAKYLESSVGQARVMVYREDLEEWAKLSALQPKPVAPKWKATIEEVRRYAADVNDEMLAAIIETTSKGTT